jgi:hypothetical protein
LTEGKCGAEGETEVPNVELELENFEYGSAIQKHQRGDGELNYTEKHHRVSSNSIYSDSV